LHPLDLTKKLMTDKKLIDDVFYIKEGVLWTSYDKEDKPLVSGLTEHDCITMTRFYLKGKQEGWDDNQSRVVNDGVVGGKL